MCNETVLANSKACLSRAANNFRNNAHSSTYTTGTGAAAWSLGLHSHTATKSNALSREQGHCLLDGFSDSTFEVANIASRDLDGDLTFDMRRKTGESGHPASGTYTLRFTARNYRGPSTPVLTITVP